eukprot:gene2123-1727_t
MRQLNLRASFLRAPPPPRPRSPPAAAAAPPLQRRVRSPTPPRIPAAVDEEERKECDRCQSRETLLGMRGGVLRSL